MGERIKEQGIRAVKQAVCTNVDTLIRFIQEKLNINPIKCVLKPISSAGSDDVYLCNSYEEAEEKFHVIFGKINGLGLINDSVLVQEYLPGKEYVVDQVSCNGIHKLCAIWEYDKRKLHEASFVHYGMYLHESSGEKAQVLVQYANKVLDALGVHYGPSHMEIMLNTFDDPETGETIYDPCLVEVGARCNGGEGCWLPIVNECIGYSQVGLTIDVYTSGGLFETIPKDEYQLKKYGCEVDVIAKTSGKLRSQNDSKVTQLSSYRNHHWDVQVNDIVPLTIDCYTIPCWIVLVANTKEEVLHDSMYIHDIEHEILDYYSDS